MLKPRFAVPAVLAAAAVAATGVAAATRHAQGTQAAAADFTAATVSRSHTDTCTAVDGTYQLTTATYKGTSTSTDPRLNGDLEIRGSSVVNTTTKLGWFTGDLRVRNTSGGAHGDVRAAIANGGLVGSLVGRASGDAKLVASISAAFAPATGLSAGKVGSGSANGAGVFFVRGECKRAKRTPSLAVFHLRLRPTASGLNAEASGNLTLDLTAGNAVFSINYKYPGAATISGLAVHQGAGGPVVLDAAVGTIADADGRGNVTKVVSGVSSTLLNALLSSPRNYTVDLDTSTPSATLRTQLSSPDKR